MGMGWLPDMVNSMKWHKRVLTGLSTLAVALALGGCATDALKLAPQSADKPWVDGENKAKATNGSVADFGVQASKPLSYAQAAVSIDTSREYDLAELIDVAQRSNPSTRIAWEKARQAALDVGMVEATMLPMISADVIGVIQRNKVPVDLGILGTHDVKTTFKGVAPFLAVQWLVFDFGERAAMASAAKDLSYAANVAFNAMHQKVIFDVTRRYHEYGATVSAQQIARQTLGNSNAVLAAVIAKQEQGTATTIEVALARQQVAQAELRMVQAQGQQQNAYQGLISALGVNANTALKIKTSTKRNLPASIDPLTNSAIEAALARRPDVLASYAAVRAGQSGIKVAQATFMPKVFVAGTLSSSSNNFELGNLPSLTGGSKGKGVYIGAAMPIYNGGLRLAQLEHAKSGAEAAAETYRTVQNDAVTEIVIATNTLKTALAAYKASTNLVSTSKVAFDGALEAYKNGLGTITLVREANNGLLDARLVQTDAYMASLIAAANLAFFTGSLTSVTAATSLNSGVLQ